jgi:LacI family transcriptional regulator
MAKRPTQADVAALAGVSRATVSYVLNDRIGGHIRITEETRQRVLQAAHTLGYEPNAVARSLRSGLSHVIGLLIPDTHNPHYLDILAGVEDEVLQHDYYVMLVSASLNPERERRCLRSLFQQRLDGLILVPTFGDLFQDEVQALSTRTSPVVFLAPQQGADYVCADVRSGAEEVMDHLASLGHRRIGFINGVARSDMARIRVQVYQEAMQALGMSANGSLLLDCGHTIQDGYAAAGHLLDLDPRPTALWTVNDLLAVGALRAVYERRLRVPDDVSLVGFDDIALAAQLHPPLTTVCINGEALGRRAAQILFRRLERPQREPMHEVIATQLVVRASTAPVRARIQA